MNATQKYAPWTPPFRYEMSGQYICDANGQQMLDVRGWGFLTSVAKIGVDAAAHAQDEMAKRVVELMNKDVQELPHLTQTQPGE